MNLLNVAFDILLFTCDLGVGINSKQRQRQNTDGLICKLHLLTLELINTLYHNTWYHNFEDRTVEKNCSNTWKKNPIIIKIHLMPTFKYLYISYKISHLIN